MIDVEIIRLLNKYLDMMEYGEIIITKHQKSIIVDVKNRDRILIRKEEKK